MPIFPNFCLGNIGQKNVLYDILERRNAFLGQKNKKFEKWKNWLFSKGVSPLLWSKNGHFSNFFFRQYKPRKSLLRYSRTKKRLSRPKKHQVRKVEKLTFSKGVNPLLWSKNGHLSNFFFWQYKPRKCLLRYSRTKKPFRL